MLILDEPTSSLDADEVQALFALIRRLRDQGVAILFVTHFLDQVYEICDRMTVLRNGRFVGEYACAKLDARGLVAAMVGREVAAAEKRHGRGTRGGAASAARARRAETCRAAASSSPWTSSSRPAKCSGSPAC